MEPIGPTMLICRDDSRGCPRDVMVYQIEEGTEMPTVGLGKVGRGNDEGWVVSGPKGIRPALYIFGEERCREIYGVAPAPGECLVLRHVVTEERHLLSRDELDAKADFARDAREGREE